MRVARGDAPIQRRIRHGHHAVPAARVLVAHRVRERIKVRKLPRKEDAGEDPACRIRRLHQRPRARRPAHQRRQRTDHGADPRIRDAVPLHRRVHERIQRDVERPQRRRERIRQRAQHCDAPRRRARRLPGSAGGYDRLSADSGTRRRHPLHHPTDPHRQAVHGVVGQPDGVVLVVVGGGVVAVSLCRSSELRSQVEYVCVLVNL